MLSELKEQNQLQQQALNSLLDKGRFVWGFPRALEMRYNLHIRKKILQRVPMVGLTCILFLLLFAGLDQFMLPPDIARITATARIFLVCPVVFFCCLWLYVKAPRFYLVPYSIAFMFASISIVWVIWLAHSHSIMLPYEGLIIAMMYGFVVMGLPLRYSCILNALVLIIYAISEPFYFLSYSTYVNNVMFLSAMYLAGFISALILSYSQRSQFLQQQLLNLSEEMARLDLESKNRYIAVASHDLRQPLQAINMMTDQLCKHSDEEKLHKLKAASNALSNMFDQLLDASKINLDLMEMHMEPVNLKCLLDQSVAAFSLPYKAKGIELNYEVSADEVCVNGDHASIQRIINNLLQNALVHSNASAVWISTIEIHHQEIRKKKRGRRAVKEQLHQLQLIIKDNGKGIAEEHKQKAFEEFNQLDSPNKDQGLGVGLSIVSKLIKAMGYKLELNGQSGCEFMITMPLCEKNAISHPTQFGETVDPGKRILIIEDDQQQTDRYLAWFKSWQWQSALAETIEKGMSLLKDKPSWVITDWNLPDGKGESILQGLLEIQQQDPSYEPNVLVISSEEGLKEKLPKGLNCQYLVKPVSASRLRAALHTVT